MRKYLFRATAALIFGVMICLECLPGFISIDSHASGGIGASHYLYPFEEAVEALSNLAKEQDIQAVVYMADTISLKSLPDEGSETVKELLSGDVVKIRGAGQDAEYNIWYQVVYEQETETVTGYILRTNLACVQEDFVEWENNYVRSVSVFRRMTRSVSYPDVEQFPQSYQDVLYQLKTQHPNWIFVKMNTGISWKTLVNNQLGERSLIYASTSPAEWKNGMYGTNWAYASEGILKYYLDPRNFINEREIFQFELLGYSEQFHTVDAVNHILSGTFMHNTAIENGKTYAQNFVELGHMTQVSPFLMASRIRQEQGAKGTSALISGTYTGYEGYYNYYNIGASGKTDKEVIESGLSKAKAEGWNSRYKSLKAGAEFLGGSYIKHGQDTLYLQKFDVDSRYDGVFWHQYMQNIEAPYKEAQSVKQAYEKAGLLDSAYVFRIPVYEGMPSSASVLPGQEDKITLSSSTITNLQVDSEVTLHPFINGEEAEGIQWEFVSSDTTVATVDENGTVTGLKPGEVVITCRKAEDMDNTIEGTCKITVIKADIDISKLQLPTLEAVIYNPDHPLSKIDLPEGFNWVNPDMVPTVAESNYGVEYNPDESRYNSIIFDLSLQVNKAIPEYSLPEELQGGATRELSSVKLPQGFSWDEPTKLLPATVGTVTFQASYNPDMENYETVEGITLTIKVVCEKHNFGEWIITEASCETDGRKERNCTICGGKEELILPATGHTYEIEVVKEATKEMEGERKYTCSECQHTYTESIPRLADEHEHSFEEEIVTKATCTTAGLIRYTCSCQDTYEQQIPSTGHNFQDGVCITCGYDGNGGNSASEEKPPVENIIPEEKPPVKEEETQDKEGELAEQNKPGSTDTSGNGQNNTNKPGAVTGAGSTTTGGNAQGNISQGNGMQNNAGQNNTSPNSGGQSNTAQNNSTQNNSGQSNTTQNNSTQNNSGQSNTIQSNTTQNNGGQSNTTQNSTTEGNTASNSTAQNNSSQNTTANSSAGNTAVQGNTAQNSTIESAAGENNTASASGTEQDDTISNTAQNNADNRGEAQIIANAVEQVRSGEASLETEADTVVISLNKNTHLSRQIIEMAADHEVNLEVSLSNGLSWMIAVSSITDEVAQETDMNVELMEGIIDPEMIRAAAGDRDYLELRLAHNGNFGFTANLTVPIGKEYIGQTANLFYINEEIDKPEFIMAATVTREAGATFIFTHASDYLIVFDAESMEGESLDSAMKEEENKEQTKENEGLQTLVFICILIMLVAVAMVVVGIWLNTKKKKDDLYLDEPDDVEPAIERKDDEYLDEPDDIEQLSDDKNGADERMKKPEERKRHKKEEYFDEDVDDYRERL